MAKKNWTPARIEIEIHKRVQELNREQRVSPDTRLQLEDEIAQLRQQLEQAKASHLQLGDLGHWYQQKLVTTTPKGEPVKEDPDPHKVEEGLGFLGEQNARVIPPGEFDKFITVREGWVFMRGWMDIDQNRDGDRLNGEGVATRFLINGLSLRTKTFLLDPTAEKIFSYYRSAEEHRPYKKKHKLATADAFRLTLQILYLVAKGYIDARGAVDEAFLDGAYDRISDPVNRGSADIFTVRDKSIKTLQALKRKIHDPYQVMTPLLMDRWVLMAEPSYFDDGWMHYLGIPSWMIGMEFTDYYDPKEKCHKEKVHWTSYAGHRVDTWAYYHIPFERS